VELNIKNIKPLRKLIEEILAADQMTKTSLPFLIGLRLKEMNTNIRGLTK